MGPLLAFTGVIKGRMFVVRPKAGPEADRLEAVSKDVVRGGTIGEGCKELDSLSSPGDCGVDGVLYNVSLSSCSSCSPEVLSVCARIRRDGVEGSRRSKGDSKTGSN